MEETGKRKEEQAEKEADLRLAISQPRASGFQTLRTSKLSLTTVQRGGRREGGRHTLLRLRLSPN